MDNLLTKPVRLVQRKEQKKTRTQLASSSSSDPSISPTVMTTKKSEEIVAYSQQSRFHRETFDANNTDIDIQGVNISINNKEILVDAHLRLKSGVRYGMVGQNGVGKSGEYSHYGGYVGPFFELGSCVSIQY